MPCELMNPPGAGGRGALSLPRGDDLVRKAEITAAGVRPLAVSLAVPLAVLMIDDVCRQLKEGACSCSGGRSSAHLIVPRS